MEAAVARVGDESVGARGPGAGVEGPRERLVRLGASALTDSELLMVLFGTGTRGNPVHKLAESLLSAGGGLRALSQSDPHELCSHPGLGPARAAQVIAALELGRRAQSAQEIRPRLNTPQDIYLYLAPKFAPLRREVFHVLSFNARNVLLSDVRVAEGNVNNCAVDPREVFRPALAARATAIVLAHNHPSGDPEPSHPDVALTQHLVGGAALLNLKVLDHLVVGDGGFTSFCERGLLSRMEEAVACGEGGRGWSRSG